MDSPVMAAAMAGMMLPTAVAFIISFARSARRLAAIALVVATYAAVWAVIGLAVYLLMGQVMIPSGAYIAGIAIVFAGLYALTPWKRHGQARCQEMCRETVRDPTLRAAAMKGLTYGLNCLACSAGVMVALLVLGMSNVALMVAGGAVILLYKLAGRWPRRAEITLTVAIVLGGAWLIAFP